MSALSIRAGLPSLIAVLAAMTGVSHAQDATTEDRLRALEAQQERLQQAISERDARIEQLEKDRSASTAPENVVNSAENPSLAAKWGAYESGKGLVLVRTDLGELDFTAYTYARYLNQRGMNETYVDAFGRTKELDLRHDLQLQKVTLNFKGWLFDPKFRYLFYAWTSNTNQGLGAQVVLGGNMNYQFNEHLTVGVGIASLPSTRSTNWTFPNWLKVDNRTMADEYFRGSFTTGVFASGEVTQHVKYRVMVGNNLSQLGVDAAQLDNNMNTVSGALWWMPTTGEYGAGEGFGDYDWHTEVATLFGVHFTHSREDAQGQPDTNSFENSQIRLSDGTLIFSPDPFGTGVQIAKATYQMAAANAGVKYRGLFLEGEVYWRSVDDFRATGALPRDRFIDRGFQLQASGMVIPKVLQAYASGSKIFGQYGDPWDAALGADWFPLERRELKINTQALYMDRSAVGYTSIPYLVGGNGWAFTADLVLAF